MLARSTFLAYSFTGLTALSLVACDDSSGSINPEDQARFAGATLVQKQRALAAGLAGDASIGILLASTVETNAPNPCPSFVRTGDTVVATGGCTDDDGNQITGSITGKNVPALFGGGNDPSKPIEITFDNYKMASAGGANTIILDGTIIARPDRSMTASLSTDLNGMTVVTDATWRPSGASTTADAGSIIELVGLGAAAIEGTWNADEDAPAGAIRLRGADVLAADFSRMANGCVPLTVDGGAAGELCDD